ncbi:MULTISPECIES: hypothetical protein [unclassified Yoonia]|uniref:hypothetical protein n=1 Tax=unclassified Yoonia TaxID=2629118 RepID=UPI0037269E15
MKRIALILGLIGLAGCGADGAPFTPNASVGVGIGSGGVSTSTTVGASNGTVSVGVGF